jgi:deoxyribodipyrimidine photo-lyase
VFRPSSDPIDPFALRVTETPLPANARGRFVLYAMHSARRLHSNLAFDYAQRRAREMKVPVVVLETMPDEATNERLQSFVLAGVDRTRADADALGVRYEFGDDGDELRANARLIVTDEHPTLPPPPAHVLVDNNGVLPMRALEKEQYAAKQFRDRARKLLPQFWSATTSTDARPRLSTGGRDAALMRLDAFIDGGLHGYANGRNRSPSHTSGLSPYLHFGYLSIHEIAARVLASGAPAEDVDAFLEEAIIRRELSFNLCFYRRDYASLAALPDWAERTLDAHRDDRRSPCYSAAELEAAATQDEVWNLAQRQLVESGTMHGYLRMLWGKKAIEWMATPEEAHAFLIAQHAKYALDGRDPNTHAGVLWCFGKHDRPWAPQRPIFGMIRYMSSQSTARKVRLREIEALLGEDSRSQRSNPRSVRKRR